MGQTNWLFNILGKQGVKLGATKNKSIEWWGEECKPQDC